MRGGVSPSTGRRYPLTMVCAVFRVARSTVYAAPAPRSAAALGKRGPQTATSDAALVVAIRAVLGPPRSMARAIARSAPAWPIAASAVGGKRVLRLMRRHQLLAPRRLGPPNGDPAHAGTITTTRPDEMWGTDATRFYTEADGWCWFFGAIDHYSADIVGWHTAKLGDRWAALEPDAAGRAPRLRPVRQGRRARAPDPV